MYNKEGKLQDTVATDTDMCVYTATIDFVKTWCFDPTTMGSVPNVGLIQKQKNMVLMTNIPNDC
jgi:monomeric isocitrate dehydrogenase